MLTSPAGRSDPLADEHGPGEIQGDGYGLLVAAVMGTFLFCIVLTIALIIVTPP